jgi:uncharacterized protein YbaR (Trm112 family)
MINQENLVCPKTKESMSFTRLADLPDSYVFKLNSYCKEKLLDPVKISGLFINQSSSFSYPVIENVPFLLDQFALSLLEDNESRA